MVQLYPIITALVFNLLDLVSGVIAALKNKDLQSSKLRDGLFKKVGFIMCYFLAWVIDTHGTLIGFNISVDVLPIIITYTCVTEITSILENIAKINADLLPDKLLELFHIFEVKE